MCKLNWRLIACATILLGLLWMSLFNGCAAHDYYTPDGCQSIICRFCGIRTSTYPAQHTSVRINCYEQKCTRCGIIENVERHAKLCATAGKCAACGDPAKAVHGAQHAWEYNSLSDICLRESRCVLCGVAEYESSCSREWVSNDCAEGIWCRKCGAWKAETAEHTFFPLFAGIVSRCRYCPYTELTVSSADWALLTAWVLGVLWVSLAFWYAIHNRRSFSLDRNILWASRLDRGQPSSEWSDWHDSGIGG